MSIRPAPNRRGRRSGYSLVEMMVAIAVGAIVAGGLMSVSLSASKTLAGLTNYLDLEDQSRRTLDVLSRDVRTAQAVTTLTSNRLTLRSATGTTITYDYTPANGRLDRLEGSWKTILSECDTLRFSLERPRMTGTPAYNDFVSASGTNGDVLSVTWSCSRKLMGSKVNTEAQQAARIVIRNVR